MLLATAFAIPTLVLAGLLIREAHQSERELIEWQLSETSRALSLVVDRQLGQAEATLKALATSPDLARDDLGAFRQQASAALPNASQWIVLNTSEGQQVVNTALSSDVQLPTVQHPPDFLSPIQRNQYYISNLVQGVSRPGHMVFVSTPVTYSRDMMGALSLLVPASEFNRILAAQKLPAPWVAAIIDREGVIVARSRRAERYVGGKATADIAGLVQAKDQAIVESVTLDGVRTVAAFTRSPTSGWSVIIGAPTVELFASARQLMLFAFLLSLVLLSLGAVAYWWFARGLMRSVSTLAAGARAVGQGKVPELVPTGWQEMDVIGEVLQVSATQLLEREGELVRLNETLEAHVKERTRQLSTAVIQLERANEELGVKNRELQEFAYVASHDLQEPLRKITTFGGLIKSEFGDVLDEHGRTYLDRMTGAATRMSKLIAGLLDYSRIQTTKGAFRRIDLNLLTKNVLLDLEVAIQEASAQVYVGELPWIEGDPTQISQLLQNLIGNALKFRKPGAPPIIRVEATLQEDQDDGSEPGCVCIITVEDNGIGFDEKYLDRIFAPFERLHGKATYPGTGIGLAICRRIAERHGGAITAQSTPGSGSTFTVSLSCRAPADGTMTPQDAEARR